MEHTRNRRKTIEEISRVLKLDGITIIGTPVTDTWEGRIWGRYLDKDLSHVSKPTREELFADLEANGFEVMEFNYYFPIPIAKIPYPRTNMEVVAIKTTKNPEELRAIHREKFQKAKFLTQENSN